MKTNTFIFNFINPSRLVYEQLAESGKKVDVSDKKIETPKNVTLQAEEEIQNTKTEGEKATEKAKQLKLGLNDKDYVFYKECTERSEKLGRTDDKKGLEGLVDEINKMKTGDVNAKNFILAKVAKVYAGALEAGKKSPATQEKVAEIFNSKKTEVKGLLQEFANYGGKKGQHERWNTRVLGILDKAGESEENQKNWLKAFQEWVGTKVDFEVGSNTMLSLANKIGEKGLAKKIDETMLARKTAKPGMKKETTTKGESYDDEVLAFLENKVEFAKLGAQVLEAYPNATTKNKIEALKLAIATQKGLKPEQVDAMIASNVKIQKPNVKPPVGIPGNEEESLMASAVNWNTEPFWKLYSTDTEQGEGGQAVAKEESKKPKGKPAGKPSTTDKSKEELIKAAEEAALAQNRDIPRIPYSFAYLSEENKSGAKSEIDNYYQSYENEFEALKKGLKSDLLSNSEITEINTAYVEYNTAKNDWITAIGKSKSDIRLRLPGYEQLVSDNKKLMDKVVAAVFKIGFEIATMKAESKRQFDEWMNTHSLPNVELAEVNSKNIDNYKKDIRNKVKEEVNKDLTYDTQRQLFGILKDPKRSKIFGSYSELHANFNVENLKAFLASNQDLSGKNNLPEMILKLVNGAIQIRNLDLYNKKCKSMFLSEVA